MADYQQRVQDFESKFPDFKKYGIGQLIVATAEEIGEGANSRIDQLEAKYTPDGKLNADYLPPIAISESHVVASEIEQLALTVQEGDLAIRTDLNKNYVALNSTNETMADWAQLLVNEYHNSFLGLNEGNYQHLTAAQLSNNAYFNVAQTWTEDQNLGLKRLILDNSSLFNLGKDLHLGGETTWVSHLGTDHIYNYDVSIGNAGNDVPLLKLAPKTWKSVETEMGGIYADKYVLLTDLEFNHAINIPSKSCDGGTHWNYINFLGGNNTDYWSSGLGFQSHDLAANKWSFFNHSNAAWGFGIPEGLMVTFGVDAPNWTILTAGGEVTFKKSDFPWDGSAGTDLLKITDTELSTEVPLDMGSNLINNVTNPTTAQGVSTKNYADTDNSIAMSPMIITGGAISEGTSGTYTVAALTAWLRATNSLTGLLTKVSLAQQTNQSITAANTTYYVCLNYNAGNPTITLAATNPYSTDKRNIPIGRVMKDSRGKVHFISGGFNFQDGIKKLHSRARELRNLELESGSTIAYSGTNNFTMATGVVYGGLNKFDFDAYNSATTDFTTVYSGFVEGNELSGIDIAFVDGGAGEDTITRVAADFVSNGYKAGDILTVSGSTSNDGDYTILSVATDTLNVATGSLIAEGAGATVTLTITKKKIDFEHYDNAGTLGNISNNKYGVFWVYKHIDDEDVYVRYGTGSYSLAEAESTKEPTKPDHLGDFGCLIGRIISPQAGGSFTEVDMVTDRFFVGTKVGDHAELGNLDYASAGHTGFATSAQGTLADSALQNSITENITVSDDKKITFGTYGNGAHIKSGTDATSFEMYFNGVMDYKSGAFKKHRFFGNGNLGFTIHEYFVYKTTQAGITAAGANQAGATAIIKNRAEISGGTGGVKLPTAVAGMDIPVTNHSGSTLNIYPASDGYINDLAQNVAKTIADNITFHCHCYAAGIWEIVSLSR